MANPEHLQILKQGVEAWNACREQNKSIRPDLARTDLMMANLCGADLRKADLRYADLRQTDLRSADLRNADLRNTVLLQTNLGGANLFAAILSGADLYWTDLTGANLTAAHLEMSHFYKANLTKADMFYASLNVGVVFSDTNLTAVRGLETCHHWAPSTLDHRSLAKSGPLPLTFLRGCGLPEALIEYLPSILGEPFQFYSCFISYASKDDAFAKQLHADLQNQGVRCWFAPEDMKTGDRICPRIDETIRIYDKLLLVLSKSSVASQWVEQEVETALARERQQGTTILFPVRIDNTVITLETGWPALIRNTRHIGDFRRWKTPDVYQKAFDRLLRDLKDPERQPEGSRPVG
jgi:uncharacterized protein YjbI with pentapeptide repeats